jgi:hypothetical protein
MLIYDHHKLTWNETANNAFAVKVLDNSKQVLQTIRVDENKCDFDTCLNSLDAQPKIIVISPIDDSDNETEPICWYYLNLENNTLFKNKATLKNAYLPIYLNPDAKVNVGFTLNKAQNITINTFSCQNKPLEYYMLTIHDNKGRIIPPKYIYTPRGVPGYNSPQTLTILLTPNKYVISVSGKYC